MDIARLIDHTLLKPEATPDQIETICQDALRYNFATVCVNSAYVELAARLLKGSDVAVCTVVGFPLGATLTTVKSFEAEQAIHDGATEIDMVINIGALKNGDDSFVKQDIVAVVQCCHHSNAICKVIIETALLTDDEKVRACKLCVQAGADFVKTSTGFSIGGANVEDVSLIRHIVGPDVGVKAAGGIRNLADAKAMITAGANRLGTSSSIKIVEESLR
jgi:deoxyribose-phosphate aldolase